MKTYDVHRYRMLVRISEFGITHRERFPAAGQARALFAAVANAVDQLTTHITDQHAGRAASRDGAVSKAGAREALNRALDAISRTARVLDIPGLRGKFHLPSVRNDHEVATAARRFMHDAAPLRKPFIAHGLPKSFLADLQRDLDAFELATHDRLSSLQVRAAAAAGIASAMTLAIRALARLDAIVANTFRDEPTLQAAWAAARHVRQVRLRGARREVVATSSTDTASTAAAGALTLVPGSSNTPDPGATA